MKFTIVIPTYNERDDARISIESAVSQSYSNKEILVVDDSSDHTPEIIKEYEKKGVVYVRGNKKGCCGARNLGAKQATGDVIVFLNADTALPPDFLEKIKPHYENGADYLLVRAEAINQDRNLSRYWEMLGRYENDNFDKKNMQWSEGFSCRREAAASVGFFPGNFSIRFCRDWVLGANLAKAGFKKIIDDSIKVTHRVPETLKEFFYFREIRGRFAFLIQYYLFEKPLWFLVPKFIIKEILAFLEIITFVRIIYKAWRISSYSPTPVRDFPGFCLAYVINLLGRTFGEWRGFFVVLRYGRGEKSKKADDEYKRRW
jgi:glycosyltransferase involved in cell wall biosynthesis